MVHSTFHLLEESRSKAIALMRNMVKLSRAEEGCISYEYFKGLTDPNRVVLFQEWQSADCLREHYNTAHMEKFINKLSDLLAQPIETRSFISSDEIESMNRGESQDGSHEGDQDESGNPRQKPRVLH